jgi:hypothetical protein
MNDKDRRNDKDQVIKLFNGRLRRSSLVEKRLGSIKPPVETCWVRVVPIHDWRNVRPEKRIPKGTDVKAEFDGPVIGTSDSMFST